MLFKRRRHEAPRRPPAGNIHLVRHGEVYNPDHLVYAALPGFHLSETGRRQAADAATHLGDANIVGVLSSPLDRARETALAIAAPHALDVDVDERLTEWRLADRWAGVAWEELDEHFPGELAAYLEHPDDLPFSPESLEEVASRMAEAILEYKATHPDGDIVVVSHQDPIQAARRHLTGRGLSRFNEGKPGHGAVITLVHNIGSDASNDPDWLEATVWEPVQDAVFPPRADG